MDIERSGSTPSGTGPSEYFTGAVRKDVPLALNTNQQPLSSDGSTPAPQRQSSSIYLIASIAALGGLLFGYDTGVISGAILYITQNFGTPRFCA